MHRCPYKYYSSLNRWQANDVYIMQLWQIYGVIFGIVSNYFIVYETYFVVGGF
jgi:hypothetical protein